MPRRNRPGRGARSGHNGRKAYSRPRDLPRDGASYLGTWREEGPGWSAHAARGGSETYLVRRMGPSSATKFYVCPGCNQNIPPGVEHVVAWPDTVRGAEYRRHWHSACWKRR